MIFLLSVSPSSYVTFFTDRNAEPDVGLHLDAALSIVVAGLLEIPDIHRWQHGTEANRS
jgi:hypothetical protein